MGKTKKKALQRSGEEEEEYVGSLLLETGAYKGMIARVVKDGRSTSATRTVRVHVLRPDTDDLVRTTLSRSTAEALQHKFKAYASTFAGKTVLVPSEELPPAYPSSAAGNNQPTVRGEFSHP